MKDQYREQTPNNSDITLLQLEKSEREQMTEVQVQMLISLTEVIRTDDRNTVSSICQPHRGHFK